MDEIFESSNIYFTASAVSYGARVQETEKIGTRVTFYLENCPEKVYTYLNREVIEEEVKDFTHLLNLYASRCLMLLPTYPTSLKDMKTLLYDR